jgi:hypothetical protein
MKIRESLLGAERQSGRKLRVRPTRLSAEHTHESHTCQSPCDKERLGRIVHEGERLLCSRDRLIGTPEHPQRHREPTQRGGLGVLTVENPVHLARFGAVEADAGLELGAAGHELAPHTAHDAGQVMRLDQRILVVRLPGKLQALLRNFARLVLIAAHEVECAHAPQRAELTRCIANVLAQLAGSAERLRGLRGTPASQGNQRVTQFDLQRELGLIASALVGQRCQRAQSARVVRDRLGVRSSADGVLAGLLPSADGRIDAAGPRVVERHHFGVSFSLARKLLDDHACDPLVKLLSPALEQ